MTSGQSLRVARGSKASPRRGFHRSGFTTASATRPKTSTRRATSGSSASALTPQLRARSSTANSASARFIADGCRSEEHTSELQSRPHLVCRLLLEKKKKKKKK